MFYTIDSCMRGIFQHDVKFGGSKGTCEIYKFSYACA